MAKKYYAVRRGFRPGIYETWAEAQPKVHGFPGPIHKSFLAREEAEAFMKDLSPEAYRAYKRKAARLATRRAAHRRRCQRRR